MPKNLVVYDFDNSFTDQDTTCWVFEVLDTKLRRLIEEREYDPNQTYGTIPDLTDWMMNELYEAGYTREQVEDALRVHPVHPAMKRAVTSLKARGDTQFLCLSNSNSIYIQAVLEAQGLSDLFDEIITNPSRWEGERLRVTRRLPPDGPQHHCTLDCSANMCKGEELDAWVNAHGGRGAFDRIVYVGDGHNDFCPITRLEARDIACVRTGRSLEKKVKGDEGKSLQARVQYWDQAWILDELFSTL